MARDSCNHTAPGSLQESLSVPVPHLSALLGRKGHKVNQQKEYKLSEASLPGLPEFTLIQWIQPLPGSDTPGKSSREEEMDTGWEAITVRRLGAVVHNNILLWLLLMW